MFERDSPKARLRLITSFRRGRIRATWAERLPSIARRSPCRTTISLQSNLLLNKGLWTKRLQVSRGHSSEAKQPSTTTISEHHGTSLT
jgi:hypothetical protein